MNIPVHPFKYTKLPKEQIPAKLARTASGPECASGFPDILAGISMTIVADTG